MIVIGTEGTYAPNSYHDEEGNLTGFDVEVGQLIARELGVEAQFVESSWDSLFAAMDSGRVDIVINEVEANEERAEKYDFSQPYTYVHGALMVRDDEESVTGFADLEGKRAAQNLTSSWGELAESYGAQLVGVDSMDQSIQLLESGRADVTLNSETAFGDYLKKHPDLFQSPAKTFVFNLAVAIVHAVLEVIIVMPLYTGYDASQLFYLLFVLVGIGSVVHSTVDFVLSLAVWKAVTASAAIRAVAVIKHIGFSESRK